MKLSTFLAVVASATFTTCCSDHAKNPHGECKNSTTTSMTSSTRTVLTTISLATGAPVPTFVPYTEYFPYQPQSFTTCSNHSDGTAEDLGALAGLLISNWETVQVIMDIPNNVTITWQYGSQKVDLLFQEASNETMTTIPYVTIANYILQVAQCCGFSGFSYCGGSSYTVLNAAFIEFGQLAFLGANVSSSGYPAVNGPPAL
jgi:hypothetical protein